MVEPDGWSERYCLKQYSTLAIRNARFSTKCFFIISSGFWRFMRAASRKRTANVHCREAAAVTRLRAGRPDGGRTSSFAAISLFLPLIRGRDFLFHMKGGLDSTLNGSVSRAKRKIKFLYPSVQDAFRRIDDLRKPARHVLTQALAQSIEILRLHGDDFHPARQWEKNERTSIDAQPVHRIILINK